MLSWLCPSASRSRSVRSAGGSGPACKGSRAGSPGRSSTVLLLLVKQESRLLGVSVPELLAGEALRAWLGDTNHQGSNRCRLAEGRGRGRNSRVLGLSKVESRCVFQRLGVGGKTTLGSGRRGNSPGSRLGLGVFNMPGQRDNGKDIRWWQPLVPAEICTFPYFHMLGHMSKGNYTNVYRTHTVSSSVLGGAGDTVVNRNKVAWGQIIVTYWGEHMYNTLI